MLIIEIGKKENIERALKRYKNKVYKTKQLNRLREKKSLLRNLLRDVNKNKKPFISKK